MGHEAIYRQLLKDCRPFRPDDCWKHLDGATDLWRPPQNPTETLASLASRFGNSEVCESGIASLDPRGELALQPAFHDPTAILAPLRRQPEAPPYDILFQNTCLSGQMPVRSAQHDFGLQQLAENFRFWILTFSMEDLASLRLAGFPAVPAHGLDSLRREDVAEIWERQAAAKAGHEDPPCPSGSPEPDDVRSADTATPAESAAHRSPSRSENLPQEGGSRLDWILAAWSPSRLTRDEPEGLNAVTSHLTAIEQHLEIGMDNVFVWRPSQEEVDRVEYCLRGGNRADVREAISASLDCSTQRAVEFPTASSSPQSLPDAASHLLDVLQNPSVFEDTARQAWACYQSHVQRELTEPLWDHASSTADPVRRNLLAAIASVSQILHTQTIPLCVQCNKRKVPTDVPNKRAAWDADFRLFLQTLDRLIHLSKELARWKPKAKSRPSPR